MRYILPHTGKIHDRDCPHVAQIPDEAFSMYEDYPNGRYVCFVCYRKALVRKGLALDQTKYIDAAMRVFQEVGATNSDLNALFLKNNPQIYRVETDCVYLKAHEDCWIIQIAENGCMLYHNNYRQIDESQRLMEADFHLQVDKPIAFQNALVTMCQYTWDGHVQAMAAKQKVHRQDALRKRLASVSSYRITDKRSLLFVTFCSQCPKTIPSDYLAALSKERHTNPAACIYAGSRSGNQLRSLSLRTALRHIALKTNISTTNSFVCKCFPSCKG